MQKRMTKSMMNTRMGHDKGQMDMLTAALAGTASHVRMSHAAVGSSQG